MVAKKAFDRVHHLTLFIVLSDRNIPCEMEWRFDQYVAYKKWCAAR